ncbi:PTS sugar transporter subunit IIA [Vibrio sp. SCSIO 43136]|uniref:PTS sugar transporter subunit IIA n=1 Tax=Vibrio sp. SCSIO 43136 TaxID=2819101 RepID=UPI002075E12C|nr:PTS sugar transporter subunit IIA [Vibrio sp. SCSIO 43136]USD68321.1 PTS sugar transporter subunit IIA [Vibrio sp. SCSIO 43136]
MMFEYQITFIVADASANARLSPHLCKLARKFKSDLSILNLTRNRRASLSHSLAIMQAALVDGDLCQITAVGIDAELACFVLKDIIADHHTLIGSKVSYEFSSQLAQRVPALQLPIATQWSYAKAQTQLTKFAGLKAVAQLIYPTNPDELILAMIKREERSSTCVTAGIALPHVMFDDVDQINIAVISSDSPIDWDSRLGEVNLIIAIVMPTSPTRDQVMAATNLTRNLLTGDLAQRLLLTRSGIELQAILMYSMTRLLEA